MTIKGVDFVLYNISDYQQALVFYRDTLGLKLSEEYGGFWLEFEVGNITLALRAPHPGGTLDNRSGGCAVALAVEDIKATMEELRQKGVHIISEPEESGVCFMAEISDPDNNLIILHQRKDSTAG